MHWDANPRARSLAALALLLALGAPGPARAEPEEAEEAAPVPLEKLLQLPSSVPVEGRIEKRAGNTRSEWEARFRGARRELAKAQEALEGARARLEKRAEGEGAWNVGAPGMTAGPPEETPLDFQLRQEIRRHREDVERGERRLTELEVEANLAGVPEDWRASEPSEQTGG